MSKKGRRGRSKKGQARRAGSTPVSLDAAVALRPSDRVPTLPLEAPPETTAPAPLLPVDATRTAPEAEPPAPVPPAEPAASAAAIDVRPPEAVEASPEPPASSSLAGSLEPEREPDATPPPVADLDARFFAESPAEAWLAHELERRDPRLLRKMTANVALRRAHLAKYVVGVVGVAVVLCLAALIKSAVPTADDAAVSSHGAGTPVPAAQPAALPLPAAAPGTPAASGDRADGGG